MFAGSIRVSFDDKKYELNLTKNFVSFDESGFSKKIKMQKCNHALIEQFAVELRSNKANISESKKAGAPKGAIHIAVDGKDGFALRFEPEGKYFSDMPSKFKNLYLTSARVCKQ